MNTATAQRPWRVLASVSWVGILLCQVAVAVSSRNIGKSAWWLGPESNPQFPLVWALPFAITIAGLVATQRPRRYTVFIHLGCVVALVGVALGDVSNAPGVALLEFVLAGIALLVSLVSLASRP
ncbi:MAG: hypothetical protein ACO3FC_05645 [Ilumatobacteraceae bacterium]